VNNSFVFPDGYRDNRGLWMWSVAYGILAGVRFASYYGAVTMIPLNLYAIFTSLTPVCTLMVQRMLIAGTKLTPLKVLYRH
jgi:EamA domain-containing membrane protein RarD